VQVIAFTTPTRADRRWRNAGDAGGTVEESLATVRLAPYRPALQGR
jgi:hypothetical protein